MRISEPFLVFQIGESYNRIEKNRQLTENICRQLEESSINYDLGTGYIQVEEDYIGEIEVCAVSGFKKGEVKEYVDKLFSMFNDLYSITVVDEYIYSISKHGDVYLEGSLCSVSEDKAKELGIYWLIKGEYYSII